MWQKFYEEHRGRQFELLSIAVDVQGAGVVRPYTDKYKVTFPVAVDTADVFGAAFGLKAIPVSYLVDEVGIIRLSGGGPDRKLLDRIESVLKEPVTPVRAATPKLPATLTRRELEEAVARNAGDWRSRLALAQQLDAAGEHAAASAHCEQGAGDQPHEPSIHFTWGLVLLHMDRRDEALARLKHARDLAPDNWRIRKQIWAIEHPDKFYESHSPDFGWQKEEIAREKAAQK